ncbi:MAG TPA: cation diffusion facilitator family transporter [Acidimicrobiales bacterium]|nr:cation diffusion facilitator family transporter [Acidimicrobiales bacterium]
MFVALATNVLVTATKITAGVIGGSSAMLSEGAHSISDSVNELFLVASIRRSERPADDRHPFGHGAERFFWSLLAAVGIFLAGGGFSLFQAYRAFTTPERAGHWALEYAVLGISGAFEGVSLFRAVHQIREEARSAGREAIEHIAKSADPALKTVAFEDSIAVFGVTVAATGIALHQITHDGRWEGVASAIIGVLLIVAAFALARDNMSLLIGESIEPARAARIRDTIASHPMVDEVIELLTRYLGAHEVLVAARVKLVDGLNSDQIERMSSDIDARLRALDPEITQVFIDPTAPEERPSTGTEQREHREQRAS